MRSAVNVATSNVTFVNALPTHAFWPTTPWSKNGNNANKPETSTWMSAWRKQWAVVPIVWKTQNKNLRSMNTKNKRWENAQTPHAQTLAHKQQQPMQTTNGKEMADCIPLRMVFHPLLSWLLMRVSTQMSAWRKQWAVVPINWKNSKIKTSDRWTLKTLRNAQTTNNNN